MYALTSTHFIACGVIVHIITLHSSFCIASNKCGTSSHHIMEPQYQPQYQQPPEAMPQQEQMMQQHLVPPPMNPAALDVIDSVPGRIGSVILRASDGAVIHRPEGGTSPVSDHDAAILYKMLREVGEVVPDDEGMKRMEISFQGGIRYTLVLADDGLDGMVFVIKRRANEQ